MWTGQPVTHEIQVRFKLSLQLAIMSTLVAVIIALPLGIISAVKQNTWIDYLVRAFSIAGIGIPSFWLGIMIILGLLIITQAWFGAGWMPPINYVSPFRRSDRQPRPAHLARPRDRLPVLRGRDPHDALGDARSAAGRLRADRAREGADRAGGHQPAMR